LWHWQAPHPEWKPGEDWDQIVSSYAIDDGTRLLLFDPLALPAEIEELAAGRETAVVLTAPWHDRDAEAVAKKLDAPVYAPPPDTQDDLMRKFGVTAEQAAGGSPDLAWLRSDDTVEGHLFAVGDRLPMGPEVLRGSGHNDVVLWIEDRRAAVVGDTLVDFGDGLEIPTGWLGQGVTKEQVVAELRPLLERPIELVLAAHGGPADRAALERALA
jgi:glyoxylase-like metal-dependent hydrolase (beta-lactamase superfamily II)